MVERYTVEIALRSSVLSRLRGLVYHYTLIITKYGSLSLFWAKKVWVFIFYLVRLFSNVRIKVTILKLLLS